MCECKPDIRKLEDRILVLEKMMKPAQLVYDRPDWVHRPEPPFYATTGDIK